MGKKKKRNVNQNCQLAFYNQMKTVVILKFNVKFWFEKVDNIFFLALYASNVIFSKITSACSSEISIYTYSGSRIFEYLSQKNFYEYIMCLSVRWYIWKQSENSYKNYKIYCKVKNYVNRHYIIEHLEVIEFNIKSSMWVPVNIKYVMLSKLVSIIYIWSVKDALIKY